MLTQRYILHVSVGKVVAKDANLVVSLRHEADMLIAQSRRSPILQVSRCDGDSHAQRAHDSPRADARERDSGARPVDHRGARLAHAIGGSLVDDRDSGTSVEKRALQSVVLALSVLVREILEHSGYARDPFRAVQRPLDDVRGAEFAISRVAIAGCVEPLLRRHCGCRDRARRAGGNLGAALGGPRHHLGGTVEVRLGRPDAALLADDSP